MPHLSIVSPVYRTEKIVDKLVERIKEAVLPITDDFEIILVDDGSPDGAWKRIASNCLLDNRVKGIKLSRNFGQHYAITAGLKKAKGDFIVVMDADLQDKPEDIHLLYKTLVGDNLHMVIASVEERNAGFFKNLGSKIFHLFFNFLTNAKLEKGIGNFGIYDKKVIEAVLKMGDAVRVFPVLVKWVGFNRAVIELPRGPRKEGSSSYSCYKLFKLAVDMGVSYSDRLLYSGITVGLFLIISSTIYGIYILIRWINGEIKVLGYTSLLIAIILMSGFILSFLGILGLYLSKMFQKVKQRPDYIISEEL